MENVVNIYIYINYKMFLQHMIKEGVGIWSDGLHVLVPLFSGVSLESEEILEDFGLFVLFLFRNV